MNMIDMHGFECPRCKMHDKFYEDFNSSKRGVSYYGVISYINHYLVMPVSSDKPKEEFPKNGPSYIRSVVCFEQLEKEWSVRQLVKHIKPKNSLKSEHFREKNEWLKEKKRRSRPKPSFYLPEHTGNLITIKKSESFTESSPDDTLCSDNLETTKENLNVKYKCKQSKRSPSKEEVATKEPKIGTLKRKRWNLMKLKPNEAYEDDLFEEKKLKRVILDDANSVEEEITTPRWSVQISPKELSRSPSYEDCYSPNELQNFRKEAEEYQYRRNKRKKYMRICKKGRFLSRRDDDDDDDSTTEMKEEDLETYKTLEEVRNKLKKLEKLDCESGEEDYYFTDGEDSDT